MMVVMLKSNDNREIHKLKMVFWPLVYGTFYTYTMTRNMHIHTKASKIKAHLCRVWQRTEDRKPASPVDREEQESEQ